jgi:hypothetical protein
MKPIKDARGETELQPREHVPAGPIQIRSQEWKGLVIDIRNAQKRLADLGSETTIKIAAINAEIDALRARLDTFKP